MPDFIIIHKGIFTEEQIKINYKANEKKYSSNIRKKIEKYWQQEKKKNKYLYNGKVLSLISSSLKESKLILNLEKTTYKAFLGTNLAVQENPDYFMGNMANILALCSVIETSDHKIVIGKRTDKVAESKKKWHVVGGNLEILNSTINPYISIKKELQEEINVLPHQIKKIICLGLGKNLEINKPELLFFSKLKIFEK